MKFLFVDSYLQKGQGYIEDHTNTLKKKIKI